MELAYCTPKSFTKLQIIQLFMHIIEIEQKMRKYYIASSPSQSMRQWNWRQS